VPPSTEDTAEPRRRHGSAPLTTAFGLTRRESAAAAAVASTSSTAPSRRSLTLDLAPPPRKLSEPGVVHKPSPLSPKRKPLPKGSTYDKQSKSQDDDLSGKLGKMELTGGSTMVIAKIVMT
jgi:hypothetical protein